jgi:hypothetical protein
MPLNVVQATIQGLISLKDPRAERARRLAAEGNDYLEHKKLNVDH